jgi:hypothetical protein
MYPTVVKESEELLQRCFSANDVGVVYAHEGRLTVLSVYSSHLECLFPQHGMGKKHERRIRLESWQQDIVNQAPWSFLRGCVRSDGCVFVNRTGPYEYLSYDFTNRSSDILDIFSRTCDEVDVDYRRYANESGSIGVRALP